MAGKPGFMMYHDGYHALDALDDAAHRRVMDAMCEYSETGAVTVGLIGAETAVFAILKNKLDADWERYQSRVEAGRKGGIRSGEARRSNPKQDEANRSNAKQTEANRSKPKQDEANEPTITIPITVTPTITPTITTTITSGEILSPSIGDGEDGERERPPTLREAQEYAEAMGYAIDARRWVLMNEMNGWKDGSGNPIRSWRLYMDGYARLRPAGDDPTQPDPRLAALEAMKREAMRSDES